MSDSGSARHILSDFAESASVSGLSNIQRSERCATKLLWTIVFCVVTLAWILHSYYIIMIYASFETTTSLAIVYKPAPFPSITLCNINPAKISTVGKYGTPELADFVEDMSPRLNYLHEMGERLSNTSENYTIVNPFTGRRRKLLHTENYMYADYVEQPDFYAGNTGLINWAQIASEADDYAVFLADPQASPYSRANIAFQELIADIPDANRTKMGHLLTDMMVYCSYDGKHCSAKNFTRHLDINYGNCWTFNSATTNPQSLMSTRSGSKYGLDLILYIDDPEYVEGLQLGRGIRYHAHPHQTMPFVNENGMSVPPGQQAFIALRLINQTRLGGSYGTCNDDNGDFRKYYNYEYLYTLEGCEHTCLDRSISRLCGCYRKTHAQYYNTRDLNTLPVCTNGTGLQCVWSTQLAYDSGAINCGCNQACNTKDYSLIPSYDLWPDISLWYGLVDAVCVREPEDCAYFRNVTYGDRQKLLRENFLHLKIYYQQLNVEEITENAAYEAGQFASDFGGTVGLWIGATAVTVVEVLDLCVRLCSYLHRKHVCNGKFKIRRKRTVNLPLAKGGRQGKNLDKPEQKHHGQNNKGKTILQLAKLTGNGENHV